MDYEITYDTQILLPLNNSKCRVVEEKQELIINNCALEIMEHSCEYFGCSYEGRKDGTKNLLGIKHKSPIIVEESRKIIFFPTMSPENSKCIWINLEKIKSYDAISLNKSKIEFKNGDILEFDISIGSLTNQILRASRLKYVLEDRLSKIEDKN